MSRWTCPTCRAVFDDQGAMKDHAVMVHRDDDVSAVLAQALVDYYGEENGSEAFHAANRAAVAAQLAALSDAGYAVVYVPEGVEVEHGARLVPRCWHERRASDKEPFYAIEDSP